MKKKRLLAFLLSFCLAFTPVLSANAETGLQQEVGTVAEQALTEALGVDSASAGDVTGSDNSVSTNEAVGVGGGYFPDYR